MIRSVALLFTLEGIYAYIKNIEIELLGEPGWQEFAVELQRKSLGALLFRISVVTFWFTLLIVTIIVALRFGPIHLADLLS